MPRCSRSCSTIATRTTASTRLFGRILRVAEDYDTLSRRSGKLSPTLALAAMLKWAGTRYDAVVLQLLVDALSACPAARLLKLEVGRVVRLGDARAEPRDLATPLARCLRLADGRPRLRPPPRGPARQGTRFSCCARCPEGSGRRIAPASLEGETQ